MRVVGAGVSVVVSARVRVCRLCGCVGVCSRCVCVCVLPSVWPLEVWAVGMARVRAHVVHCRALVRAGERVCVRTQV